MIGRLRGTLVRCDPGEALVDVAGVGYSLAISLQTFWAISTLTGSECTLHVHTHVREDALALFGFHLREEKDAFLELTAISGVGPRLALAVLSGIGVEELQSAVAGGDRARLQSIPGVGRKTAERILLELADRTTRRRRRAQERDGDDGRPRGAPPVSPAGVMRADAVSALVHLGYSEDVAVRAVEGTMSEAGESATDLESVLRGALRRLVR